MHYRSTSPNSAHAACNKGAVSSNALQSCVVNIFGTERLAYGLTFATYRAINKLLSHNKASNKKFRCTIDAD